MPPEPAPTPPTCVTCHTPLAGPYCHACGERTLTPEDERLGAFLRDAAAGAFDLDSRLWRTARELVRRPGHLTAEYLRGRRRPYLGPLQAFLLANLLFFATLATVGGFNTFTTQLRYHTGMPGYGGVAERLVARQAAPDTPEREAYARRFDAATGRYANSLVILMVPMLAGVLALLYGGRRPYVHHVTMALHFMVFQLLVLVALPLALRVVRWVTPVEGFVVRSDLGASLVLLVGLSIYLALALRRAYGDGALAAGARALVTLTSFVPILMVYRAVLFFAVYFTLD